jgi:hypothetical protein
VRPLGFEPMHFKNFSVIGLTSAKEEFALPLKGKSNLTWNELFAYFAKERAITLANAD